MEGFIFLTNGSRGHAKAMSAPAGTAMNRP